MGIGIFLGMAIGIDCGTRMISDAPPRNMPCCFECELSVGLLSTSLDGLSVRFKLQPIGIGDLTTQTPPFIRH